MKYAVIARSYQIIVDLRIAGGASGFGTRSALRSVGEHGVDHLGVEIGHDVTDQPITEAHGPAVRLAVGPAVAPAAGSLPFEEHLLAGLTYVEDLGADRPSEAVGEGSGG